MNCPPHRFRISEQDGNPRVPGTCQHCGEVRDFATSEEGYKGNWMIQTRERRKRHIVLTRPKDHLAGLGRQPRTTR